MGITSDIPVHRVFWRQSWRIIPTRYPEENLYKRIAQPKDLKTLCAIEQLTNQREQLQSGEKIFLRAGDKLPEGRSAYNVAAAFSHLSSSRFSDGTFPIYYAARKLQTAIEETCHHRQEFMKATQQKPMMLRMRVLVAHLDGSLHDLRKNRKKFRAFYSPTHYEAAQVLGRQLWLENSNGLVYDSVRHATGQCVALFSPQLIRHCRQERCLQYDWDGRKITAVYGIYEYPR